MYPRDSEVPHEIVGKRLVESGGPGAPGVTMLSLRPLLPEGASTVDMLKADTVPLYERFSDVWWNRNCDQPSEANAAIRSAHIAAVSKHAAGTRMSMKAQFVELRWGRGQPAMGECPPEVGE